MLSRKRFLLAALSLLCAGSLMAQNDFGVWTSVSAEKSFGKNFSIDAGVENRLQENATKPLRWDFGLGASYKVRKFLKLGAGYTYIRGRNLQEVKPRYKNDGVTIKGYNVDHEFWRNKHRLYFDVTGKVTWGRFTFSLRERYLYTHYNKAECLRDKYKTPIQPGYVGDTTYINGIELMKYEQTTDQKKAKDKHALRSRLQVEYNIKGLPLNPYASYEVTNDLGNQLRYDKSRVCAGLEWKVTKKHILDFGYLYQTESDNDEGNSNIHAIKVGYTFKF